MGKEELAPLVVRIVEDCAPEPSGAPTIDLRLIDDLGYESLSLMELATDLALAFSTGPIGEKHLVDVSTVGDVVELMVELTS